MHSLDLNVQPWKSVCGIEEKEFKSTNTRMIQAWNYDWLFAKWRETMGQILRKDKKQDTKAEKVTPDMFHI